MSCVCLLHEESLGYITLVLLVPKSVLNYTKISNKTLSVRSSFGSDQEENSGGSDCVASLRAACYLAELRVWRGQPPHLVAAVGSLKNTFERHKTSITRPKIFDRRKTFQNRGIPSFELRWRG